MDSVYFIGIGGIGMSALARYYNMQGIKVSGYDKTETTLTKKLVSEGIDIHYAERLDLIPYNPDLVIITPAIPKGHKEWEFYKQRNVPILKRSEVLGLISREKKCVAVAGTHGKTSTSAILSYLLQASGMAINAFVGGIMANYGTNYIGSNGDWVVLEADEFDRSFLHLKPQIAIVLSMDPDHLDIYSTGDSIKEAYRDFCRKINDGGLLVYNMGIRNDLGADLILELEQRGIRCISYGSEDGADWVLDDLEVIDRSWELSTRMGQKEQDFQWNIPGRHNAENALAAIGVSMLLGLNPEIIRKNMPGFKGIQRRFEIVFKDKNRCFVDDYAHHPTEIRAAHMAIRQMLPGKDVTAIFQPHLYSRTRDFYKGFAETLDLFDEVILMPIYPARELPMEGVSTEIIRNEMNNKAVRIASHSEVMEILKHELEHKEVIITLGAGDINLLVPQIKALLSNE